MKRKLETTEILRYICFALFAIYTVMMVLSTIPTEAFSKISAPYPHFSSRVQGSILVLRNSGLRRTLMLAEGILICTGIFTKKRILSAGAFLLLAVGKVLGILKLLSFHFPAMGTLSEFALLAAFAVAAFCCLTKDDRNTRLLGIISAVMLLLSDILFVSFYHRHLFATAVFPIKFYLRNIIFYAAFVLLGFAFEGVPGVAVVKAPKSVHSATENKVERLTKLKDLLDKGILTQEEFEEKKKQILDT